MAKILAADDDEAWRDLLSRWLRNKGYEVALASRGQDVVPEALRFRPHAVVLDYDLGDQMGTAVCAALKSHPALKSIPVVLLTSLAGKMLQIFSEHKPDHFVVKGEHPDELLFVLEGLLESKGPTSTDPKDPSS